MGQIKKTVVVQSIEYGEQRDDVLMDGDPIQANGNIAHFLSFFIYKIVPSEPMGGKKWIFSWILSEKGNLVLRQTLVFNRIVKFPAGRLVMCTANSSHCPCKLSHLFIIRQHYFMSATTAFHQALLAALYCICSR